MVKLNYSGKNNVFFGKTRIMPGENEINDDLFDTLMKHPGFKSRIQKSVFKVPKDFLLNQDDKDVDQEEQEEEQTSERLSVKQTLKNIQKSKDLEYLRNLLETDDREKVKEAAKEKLESLEK